MNRAREAQGFSLLEVLVAFAILALSLAVILQIFSTGLRSAALSQDYMQATSLAEAKLTELGRSQQLEEGTLTGVFDDEYRWRATIQLAEWWQQAGGERLPVRPYEVSVEVFWGVANQERSLRLNTLRLVAAQ